MSDPVDGALAELADVTGQLGALRARQDASSPEREPSGRRGPRSPMRSM